MQATKSLPAVAKGRITRELSQLATSPPPGISCYAPFDNITYLHAQIQGPPDTPFSSGIFLLSIQIPERYPFEPPKVRFLTRIYHPNIDLQGRICLDTLKTKPTGSWSPAVSLPSLLLTLRALMEKPNGDDGLVPETTHQFNTAYNEWYLQAKSMTEREATDVKLLEREEAVRNALNDENKEQQVQQKKSFKLKRTKVNRLSKRRDNVMDIDGGDDRDDDMNMESHCSTSSATGKRKSGDLEPDEDLDIDQDRDTKFRRGL